MKKLLCLAAVLTVLTGGAQAATLQVTLGPSLSFGTGSDLSPNIDLATFGGLTRFNADIVPTPAVPGPYVPVTGPVFANSFLSVYGAEQSTPPGTNGTATFNLTPNQNIFGFTWGSIDSFNTLVLKDSTNTLYTITGTDILNNLSGSVAGETQADVKFVDPLGTIVSAFMTSTVNSFESANFSQTQTPLPPAVLMFGAALLGFVAFSKWRQRGAGAA